LDLYHSHCHHNPVSGFRKGYQEAERFGTTDRVYRRAVKELMDKGLVERGEEGLQIRDLAGLKAFLEQP
ncbi:Crp/Fnr family transcriptional regulator, partial [Aeromonas hydrophila]|nr:Crp/Fnr family transcriptional regulator [Aeromonas hydrophila]